MKAIFDIEKIKRNREWAEAHSDGHDFLHVRAIERMIDNLSDIQRDFENILIIGDIKIDLLNLNFNNKNINLIKFIDFLGLKINQGEFDCVLIAPCIHLINDVVGFLQMMKAALKPDGLFMCSFFGGNSLQELRASILEAEVEMLGGASQHIHPMIDHYQFAGLLQSIGFALPVVDFDRVVVEYSDLENLYTDLRNMGESNALLNRNSNINKLKQDIEIKYKNKFYNSGFMATFDIVHGIGWAPHSSQQQPAKRGSGQVSLTEIL